MNKQKQYGLIGYPLGHSFSRGFFTEKFLREGIDAMYSNYEIPSVDQLETILEANAHLVGFNVTIPHKENIIPLLSAMSDEAKAIGAVNVVKVTRDGNSVSLKGYNSDVVGFVNSIKPLLNMEIHRKALVLGTGGASKAVVYGLNGLVGIETQLVSRSKLVNTITYEELNAQVLKEYKVIVNCSPLGTFPKVDEAPAIPYDLLGTEHLLYDLVYNPAETEFLKRGKAKGTTIKNGAEMLELQAIEAWRIWNEEK